MPRKRGVRGGVDLRVQPVGEGVRKVCGQFQQRQQALEARELRQDDLALPHQVVEIESALLVLEVAGELAVVDRQGR